MRSNSKSFLYSCDSCGIISYFTRDSVARYFGWSVSSSYYVGKLKRCWCPKCAGPHRRGKGATGRPLSNGK